MSPKPRPTPDGRLVVLDGSRLAGLRDWRGLADLAAQSYAAGAADGVLLDVRRAPFTPTADDAADLVAALARYAAAAIVSGADASYGCARMVSTLVELRGSKAAAFFTEDEAAVWLAGQVGCEPGGTAAARKRALP